MGFRDFPWHGRSEGDTVQYFYEYGRACAGSYCDVSGIQLGICKPCVGESDRVDRDASFEIPLLMRQLKELRK